MTKWYQLSEPGPGIDPAERGFHYGDGLFETVAIRDHAPRLWEYHVRRLTEGCRRLGLEPPDATTLLAKLQATIADSPQDADRCIAKIVVTAGASERGYGRAMPTPGSVYIGVFPAAPADASIYETGVSTVLCDTRLAEGSPVAGLKTLNRLEQVLGRSECLQAGSFEGLMLDAGGRLICGTMSNVFTVRDRIVRTPSLHRCGVAGTMRAFLLDLYEKEGLDLDVTDISFDGLASSDEVFLANSQMGAVPVVRCGSATWQVGDVTRQVIDLLGANGIGECRS